MWIMHVFSLWIWSTCTISQIKVEYLQLLNILSRSRFEYRGSFSTLHAYVPITFTYNRSTSVRVFLASFLLFYFLVIFVNLQSFNYKVIPFPEEERIVQSIYGLWYMTTHICGSFAFALIVRVWFLASDN